MIITILSIIAKKQIKKGNRAGARKSITAVIVFLAINVLAYTLFLIGFISFLEATYALLIFSTLIAYIILFIVLLIRLKAFKKAGAKNDIL